MQIGAVRVLAMMVAALLVAGCLGGDADVDGIDSAQVESDDEISGETNTDGLELPDEIVERAYDGGILIGAGLPVAGSAGLMSQPQDVSFPAEIRGGTLTFSWTGTAVGGLYLSLMGSDGPVARFDAPTSPLVVELDADDSRLKGAQTITAWTLAPGASVEVAWSAVFELTVPGEAE